MAGRMTASRRLRPSLGNGRLPDFHCKSSGSVCCEDQDRFWMWWGAFQRHRHHVV